MPPRKSNQELSFGNIFSDFVHDLSEKIDESADGIYNILDFIKYELDLGIELTLQQRTILKTYYNLELTDEEMSVVEYWKSQKRTTWEPGQRYQFLVLESGRRSGKSTIASIIIAYEFYKLCRLKSPQEYYGIARSTSISIIVLATTATQGKRTIFNAVCGVIRDGKYFKRLQEQGKLFIGKEYISLEEKLLYIYSGNSQSSAQVGGTVKALVLDEAARFRDTDGNSNAMELWSNLGIATTTFKEDAMRIALSSAWYEGDAIQRLYAASELDAISLGFRLRSWDVNPIHAARDNPVVASEYATDPAQAALEFEGLRKPVENPFFNTEEVQAGFRGANRINTETYIEEEGGYNLVKNRIISIEKATVLSVAHLDPSINTDAYALAFGHNEFNDNDLQIVVIDGLIAWEPTYQAQVSITNVLDVILGIHEKRPLQFVSADHYNSAETMQRVRQHGIPAEARFFSNRLQYSMYSLARTLLHEGRLILPADSPFSSVALSELVTVRLIRGMKIDHAPGGSKDMADAIVSVCWTLCDRIMRDQAAGMIGQGVQVTRAARSSKTAHLLNERYGMQPQAREKLNAAIAARRRNFRKPRGGSNFYTDPYDFGL
jgi:hypothetical protein